MQLITVILIPSTRRVNPSSGGGEFTMRMRCLDQWVTSLPRGGIYRDFPLEHELCCILAAYSVVVALKVLGPRLPTMPPPVAFAACEEHVFRRDFNAQKWVSVDLQSKPSRVQFMRRDNSYFMRLIANGEVSYILTLLVSATLNMVLQ